MKVWAIKINHMIKITRQYYLLFLVAGLMVLGLSLSTTLHGQTSAVTVERDPAFGGITTSTIGSTVVYPIAAFKITTPPTNGLRIDRLVFDRDLDSGLGLRRLDFYIGNKYLGTRQGSQLPSAGIIEVGTSTTIIGTSTQMIVSVRASWEATSTAGVHISPIDLVGWSATNLLGATATFPGAVEGQNLTLLAPPPLAASIIRSVASTTAIVGQFQRIASFRITLQSNIDGLKITKLFFDKDLNANLDLESLVLALNGYRPASSKSQIGDEDVLIEFSTSTQGALWTIPAGSAATVDIFAQISSSTIPGVYASPIDFIGWEASGSISGQVVNFPGIVEGLQLYTFTAPPPPPPSLRVLSPNGGEVWKTGETHIISWQIQNDNVVGLDTVINLSKVGDSQFSYSLNLPNGIVKTNGSGSYTYSWTIPSFLDARSDYRVSVAVDGGNYGLDQSDAPFTITIPAGSVAASPSSGTAPLSGVDVTVNAGGVTGDRYVYKFNCNNGDGSYDLTTPTLAQSIHTALDLCNYSSPGTYTVLVDVTRYRTTSAGQQQVTNFALTTTVTVGGVVPPPPGGIFSRLRNVITSVFVGFPSVDVKVKAPYDAPDENYTDGPIQIAPGSTLKVSWQLRRVENCRINYFGLLPTNLGASAENQAGYPLSSNESSAHSLQSPNEEGFMEFEVQCRRSTDGSQISDKIRVDLKPLTAGTAGGITPPPPAKGFFGRLGDRITGVFGGRVAPPPAPPAAPSVQLEETVPPIAGGAPSPDESIPPIAGIQEPAARGEGQQAPSVPPVTGIRGLLNAIRRVPETARTAVQKAIELVVTRPQAPTLDTAEPVGVTPKPAEPVGITPKLAEPPGSIPPIAGVKEPAQTVPPIAGIAIPSLTNNVLNLGRGQSITWRYQRGEEVQAPVVHVYLVGEGVNPRTGQVVRRYAYIGQARADAGSFAWSVPSNFVKPLDPCCTFTYRIGIGLSANPADPELQSTSNPITVEETPKLTEPLITPKAVEPVAPPPTLIPTRTVEPLAPPPPPPSTILEPTKVLPPPPPAPPPTTLEPVLLSPKVDLKVNSSDGPVTISSGASATLSWTSSGAASCTASNGWSGTKATSGSASTGGLTASKTYTLTCSNKAGSVSDSVSVNVQTLKLKLFYNQEDLRQIASVLEQLLEIVKKLNDLTLSQ